MGINLDELRGQIRGLLAAKRGDEAVDLLDAAADEAGDAVDEIVANAERSGRTDLLASEQRAFDAARKTAQAVAAMRSNTYKQLAAESRRAGQKAADDFEKRTTPVTARVTNEPGVYRPDGEHSFFRDLVHRSEDPAAGERLARHQEGTKTEQRDAATSAFGALVPPQYLTAQYAENLRAGRPFLNAVTSLALPSEGMSLEVPRGTTATTVLQQTTENTGVSETDFDETTLSVPVRTHSGQQDVSRQGLDRGRGVDQIIMSDLASAYATRVDWEALNGTGASGTMFGVRSTTGISTVTCLTASAIAHIRGIIDASQQIASTRFAAPTLIVAHPRRWGFWAAATDSSGRPLVDVSASGMNTWGAGNLSGNGPVGSIAGIPVVLDPNIPTTVSTSTITGATEDVVIVTRREDVLHWSEPGSPEPLRVRYDATGAGNLTVKIVAWGYNAFDAGRYPTATRILTGSGFGTPSFA